MLQHQMVSVSQHRTYYTSLLQVDGLQSFGNSSMSHVAGSVKCRRTASSSCPIRVSSCTVGAGSRVKYDALTHASVPHLSLEAFSLRQDGLPWQRNEAVYSRWRLKRRETVRAGVELPKTYVLNMPSLPSLLMASGCFSSMTCSLASLPC